jgi:hypothetical protein
VRPWFADRPIEQIGPAEVRRWQRDLAARVGPATLGQCRSLALRIFQFAVDEGAIDTNPVRKVPAPKRRADPDLVLRPGNRRALTPEEAGQLLACFPLFWWDHVITLRSCRGTTSAAPTTAPWPSSPTWPRLGFGRPPPVF